MATKHRRKQPITQLDRHVVLVGMMGVGKSTIGMGLSRRLGRRFLDTDAEIVAAAGMSVADIFSLNGEAWFRAKENKKT